MTPVTMFIWREKYSLFRPLTLFKILTKLGRALSELSCFNDESPDEDEVNGACEHPVFQSHLMHKNIQYYVLSVQVSQSLLLL